MAKQMEIHPDHNDVINAAESTLRHAWESLYMCAATLIQAHVHVYQQKLMKKKADFVFNTESYSVVVDYSKNQNRNGQISDKKINKRALF